MRKAKHLVLCSKCHRILGIDYHNGRRYDFGSDCHIHIERCHKVDRDTDTWTKMILLPVKMDQAVEEVGDMPYRNWKMKEIRLEPETFMQLWLK